MSRKKISKEGNNVQPSAKKKNSKHSARPAYPHFGVGDIPIGHIPLGNGCFRAGGGNGS